MLVNVNTLEFLLYVLKSTDPTGGRRLKKHLTQQKHNDCTQTSMRLCTFQEEIEVSAPTQRATATVFVLLHQNSYDSFGHHLFFSSSAARCSNHEPGDPTIDEFMPHMTLDHCLSLQDFFLTL